MPNEVKLGDGHPVDKELKPLKVGGKTTSIETAEHGKGARVTGGLEVTGGVQRLMAETIAGKPDKHLTLETITSGEDIILHPARVIYCRTSPDINVIRLDPGAGVFEIGSLLDTDDYFRITTTTNGATNIATVDDGGANAFLVIAPDGYLKLQSATGEDITLDSGGDIILDSADGNFLAKKAGTEFSAANSAYAGMILGYTRIQNDQTGAISSTIAMTSSMTVLTTANGTNISIAFTAPPSGNVEILFSCALYTSSTTVGFALSDNATFNEVSETHTYDAGAYKMDETDINTITIPFAVTGLTAGTAYTYYIAGEETSGSTSVIYHGRLRTTGNHYPPITVKAVALPATITTGE